MKLARKEETSLESEYNEQKAQDYKNLSVGNTNLDIVNILGSFE